MGTGRAAYELIGVSSPSQRTRTAYKVVGIVGLIVLAAVVASASVGEALRSTPPKEARCDLHTYAPETTTELDLKNCGLRGLPEHVLSFAILKKLGARAAG
eukprot:4062788-Prymnesium_polylepis.1